MDYRTPFVATIGFILVITVFLVIFYSYNECAHNYVDPKNLYSLAAPVIPQRIAIVSSDDRDAEFVQIHNYNLQRYCSKYGYSYFFHHNERPSGYTPDFDNWPVFWKKMGYMDYYLDPSQGFDYVMWIDTDAFIVDDNVRLEVLMEQLPRKDIAISSDNSKYWPNDAYCAGIFVVRSTAEGRTFVKDCLRELTTHCIKNGKYALIGTWAGDCYEQGVMNKLLKGSYAAFTTVVSRSIFSNTVRCEKSRYILHSFGDKTKIVPCLRRLYPAIVEDVEGA